MAVSSPSFSLELPSKETSLVQLLIALIECCAATTAHTSALAQATQSDGTTSEVSSSARLPQATSSSLSSLKGSVNPPSSPPPPPPEQHSLLNRDGREQGVATRSPPSFIDENVRDDVKTDTGRRDDTRVHALCQRIVEVLLERERSWYRGLVCVDLDLAAVPEMPYVMDGEEELRDVVRLRTSGEDVPPEAPREENIRAMSRPRNRVRALTRGEVDAAASSWSSVLIRDAHLQRCLAKAVEQLEKSRGDPCDGVTSSDGVDGKATTAAAAGSGEMSRARISWTPTSLRHHGGGTRSYSSDGESGCGHAAAVGGDTAGSSPTFTSGVRCSAIDMVQQLAAATTTSSRTITMMNESRSAAAVPASHKKPNKKANSAGTGEAAAFSPLAMPEGALGQKCPVKVPSLLHMMLGNGSADLINGKGSPSPPLTSWMEENLFSPAVSLLHDYSSSSSTRVAARTQSHAEGGHDASMNSVVDATKDVGVQLHMAMCQLLRLPSLSSAGMFAAAAAGDADDVSGAAPSGREVMQDSKPHTTAAPTEGQMISCAMPLIVGVVCRRQPAASVEEVLHASAGTPVEPLFSSWGVRALDASGLRIRLLPASQIAQTTHGEAGSKRMRSTAARGDAEASEGAEEEGDGVSLVSSITTSGSTTDDEQNTLGTAASSRRVADKNSIGVKAASSSSSSSAVPPVRFCACVLELSGAVVNEAAAREVWLMLVSILHFVHVVGTRAYVEEVALYVSEAVREKRQRRANATRVHPLKAAQEGSLAEVSAPVTVLNFFFSLEGRDEVTESDWKVSGEHDEQTTASSYDPAVRLFSPVPDAEECETAVEQAERSAHAHHRHSPAPAATQAAGSSPFQSSPPLKASSVSPRLMPPPQLTALASARGKMAGSGTDHAAAAATSTTTTRTIAEWMYEKLIPTFFDITYEDVTNETEADCVGADHEDAAASQPSSPLLAQEGALSSASRNRNRRRGKVKKKRRKKTSLLARVQFISDAHVDLLRALIGEDDLLHEAQHSNGADHAGEEMSRADSSCPQPARADLGLVLRVILCRQLLFRDVVHLAVSHYGNSNNAAQSPEQAQRLGGGRTTQAASTPHIASARGGGDRDGAAALQVAPFPTSPRAASPTASPVANTAISPSSGKRRVSFNQAVLIHPATTNNAPPAIPSPSSPPTRQQQPRGPSSLLSSYSSLASSPSTPVPVTVRSAALLSTPASARRQLDVSALNLSNTARTEMSLLSTTTTPTPTAENNNSNNGATVMTPPVKSILKSGHRYRVSKLIHSSAPAVSTLPMNGVTLWRCLVAEQLVIAAASSASLASSTTATTRAHSPLAWCAESGDGSWAGFFHLTSTAYVTHVSSVVTRATDEIGSLLLLGAIRDSLERAKWPLSQTHTDTEHGGQAAKGTTPTDGARHRHTRDAAVLIAVQPGPTTSSSASSPPTVSTTPRALTRRVLFSHLARLSEALTNTLNGPLWYAQLNPSGPAQHPPNVLTGAAKLTSGEHVSLPAVASTMNIIATNPTTRDAPGHALQRPPTVACSSLAPILPLSVASRFRLYCEVSSRTCVFGALLYVCPIMDANLRGVAHALLSDKMKILSLPLVQYVTQHLLDAHAQPWSTFAYTQAQEKCLRLISQLSMHLTGTIVLPNVSRTSTLLTREELRARLARTADGVGSASAVTQHHGKTDDDDGEEETEQEEEESAAQGSFFSGPAADGHPHSNPAKGVGVFGSTPWRCHAAWRPPAQSKRLAPHAEPLADIISSALRPASSWIVPGEASQYDLESALVFDVNHDDDDDDGDDDVNVNSVLSECKAQGKRKVSDVVEAVAPSRAHPASSPLLANTSGERGHEGLLLTPLGGSFDDMQRHISSLALWLPVFMNEVPNTTPTTTTKERVVPSRGGDRRGTAPEKVRRSPAARENVAETEAAAAAADLHSVVHTPATTSSSSRREEHEEAVRMLCLPQLEPMQSSDVCYVTGASESPLLAPWLSEAKKLVLSSFLSSWFLPRWAQWSTRVQPRLVQTNATEEPRVPPSDDNDDDASVEQAADMCATRAVRTPPPPSLQHGNTAGPEWVAANDVRAALTALAATACQLESTVAEVKQAAAHVGTPPLPGALPLPPLSNSPSSSPSRQPRRLTGVPQQQQQSGTATMMSPVPSASLTNASLTPPRSTPQDHAGAMEGPLRLSLNKHTHAADTPLKQSPVGAVLMLEGQAAPHAIPTSALPLTPMMAGTSSSGGGGGGGVDANVWRRRVSFSDGPPPGAGSNPLTPNDQRSLDGRDYHDSHQQQQQQPVPPGKLGTVLRPPSPGQDRVSPRSLQQGILATQAQAAQLLRDIEALLRQLPPPKRNDNAASAGAEETTSLLGQGMLGSRCSSPSEEELPKAALSRVASQRYAPLHLAAAPCMSVSRMSGVMGHGGPRPENSSFFGVPMGSLANSDFISLPTAVGAEEGRLWGPADSVLTVSRPRLGTEDLSATTTHDGQPSQQAEGEAAASAAATRAERSDEEEESMRAVDLADVGLALVEIVDSVTPDHSHTTRGSGPPLMATREAIPTCDASTQTRTVGHARSRDQGADSERREEEEEEEDDVHVHSGSTHPRHSEPFIITPKESTAPAASQPWRSPTPAASDTDTHPSHTSSAPSSSQRRSPSVALSLDPAHLGRPMTLSRSSHPAHPPIASATIAETPSQDGAKSEGGEGAMSSPDVFSPSALPLGRAFNLPTARPPLRETSRGGGEEDDAAQAVAEAPILGTHHHDPQCTPPRPRPHHGEDDAQDAAEEASAQGEALLAALGFHASTPPTKSIGDSTSLSLSPAPTPKALAAVAALADLQQRLSGSKGSLDALTRRAHEAEEALEEKEALVCDLQRRLADLEAQLARAESRTPVAHVAAGAVAVVEEATSPLRTPIKEPIVTRALWDSAREDVKPDVTDATVSAAATAAGIDANGECEGVVAFVASNDTRASPATRVPQGAHMPGRRSQPPPPPTPPASTTPLNSLELWRQRRQAQKHPQSEQQQQQQQQPQQHVADEDGVREAHDIDATSPTPSMSASAKRSKRATSSPPPPPPCTSSSPAEAEAEAAPSSYRSAPHTPPHVTVSTTPVNTIGVDDATIAALPAPPPPPSFMRTPKPVLATHSTQTSPLPALSLSSPQSLPVPPSPPPAAGLSSASSSIRADSPVPPEPPGARVASEDALTDAAAFHAAQWRNILESARKKHMVEKEQLEHRLRQLSAEQESRERSVVTASCPPDGFVSAEEVVALESALVHAREQLRAAREQSSKASLEAQDATERAADLEKALREAEAAQETLRVASQTSRAKAQASEQAMQAAEKHLRQLTEEVTVRRAQRDRAEEARRQADDLAWAHARITRHVLHQERSVLIPWMQQQLDLFASAAASVARPHASPHRPALGGGGGGGGHQTTSRSVAKPGPRRSTQNRVDDDNDEKEEEEVSSSSSDTSSPASTASYTSHEHTPTSRAAAQSPVNAAALPGKESSRRQRRGHRAAGASRPRTHMSTSPERQFGSAAAAAALESLQDDPLGLRYALERQRRRGAALEEALAQHANAHEADLRTIRKLQHLLDVQRDLGPSVGGDGPGGPWPPLSSFTPQLPWAVKASFLPAQAPPASSSMTAAQSSASPANPSRERSQTTRSHGGRGGPAGARSLSVISVVAPATAAAGPSTPSEVPHGDAAGATSPLPRRAPSSAFASTSTALAPASSEPVRRAQRGVGEDGSRPSQSSHSPSYPLSAIENSRAAAGSADPAATRFSSSSRSYPRPAVAPVASAANTMSNSNQLSAAEYRQRYASLKAYL